MLSKPPLPRKYHYWQNKPRVFTVASLLPSLLRWRVYTFYADESTILRWWIYDFTLTNRSFYADWSTLLRWRVNAFTLTNVRFYADESTLLRWRIYDFTLTSLRFYADESTILRWRVYAFTLMNLCWRAIAPRNVDHRCRQLHRRRQSSGHTQCWGLDTYHVHVLLWEDSYKDHRHVYTASPKKYICS